MNKRILWLLPALLGGMVLMILLVHAPPLAHAADLTVCPAGPPDCQYDSVQAAVDAASPGDVIKVSAGTYDDVNNYGGLAQVVYVDKTVTIRGGYTTDFTDPPDPEANPTTLDALGLGRVLYITGNINPTIEGLRLTGGDASGLVGTPWHSGDAGGGVYVHTAGTTISNCVVYSNTASTTSQGFGGGVYLFESPTTLSGNLVLSNTATMGGGGGGGGGLYIRESEATLIGNTVQGNIASGKGSGGGVYILAYGHYTLTANLVQGNIAGLGMGSGGGLYLAYGHRTLTANTVQGNIASTGGMGWGGGLSIKEGEATLIGNTVRGNIASTGDEGEGGGLELGPITATLTANLVQGNIASTVDGGEGGGLSVFLDTRPTTLSGNTIISNTATLSPTATGRGGGLWVRGGGSFTLTNNLVAGNQANTEGSGLWLGGDSESSTSGRLLHTTVADNTASGDSGQGVFVGGYITLTFTNTIIAGHSSVGITVTAGSTATLEATLWHDNGVHIGGGGTILTGTINVYDAPVFVGPEAGDYHLGAGSAAIDAGVDAGVTVDLDGDSRPQGAGYDIGADEVVCLTGAAISGPVSGIAGIPYTLTATASPPTATLPITYTWQASGQAPLVVSGGLTYPITYTWAEGGLKVITVTLSNGCGPVTATHAITICQPLTAVYIAGPAAGVVGASYPFTATVSSADATAPIVYTWSPEPDSGQGTAHATYSWPAAGAKTIGVVATNCSGTGAASDEHTITICRPVSDLRLRRLPEGDLFAGNSVRFLAFANGSRPFAYAWTLDGAPVGGNSYRYDHTFEAAGSYMVGVTVTNECGEAGTSLVVDVSALSPGQSDLSPSDKTVSRGAVEEGDVLTYTLFLRNQSGAVATAKMTDPIPPHTAYVAGSGQASDGGPVTLEGGSLMWSGQVISGTPVVIQFQAEVQAAPEGTGITNTATVDDGQEHVVVVEAASTYAAGYELLIDGGTLATNVPTVTLDYAWDAADGITQVMFSNDPGFGPGGSTTDWLPVDPGDPTYAGWVLDVTGEVRRSTEVHARFRDGNGEIYGPVCDAVLYDPDPPSDPGLEILSVLTAGARRAASSAVVVRVTAYDANSGVSQVQISDDPAFAVFSAFPFVGPMTEVPWALPASGMVYVRVVDRAGNLSAVVGAQGEVAYHLFLPLVQRAHP